MRFRDGLVAARGHLIFIVVLCVLFGALQHLDRTQGGTDLPEASATTIQTR